MEKVTVVVNERGIRRVIDISIRRYVAGEELLLRELFFHTIREVNIRDYTEQQVKAWAPSEYNRVDWISRVESTQPYVAVVDNKIAGYADVQADGYIDHFYCHSRYQGKGVGTMLMKALLNEGQKRGIERLYSHVSITARPFFEKYGFSVLKQQSVCIRGVNLTNYVMEKCKV